MKRNKNELRLGRDSRQKKNENEALWKARWDYKDGRNNFNKFKKNFHRKGEDAAVDFGSFKILKFSTDDEQVRKMKLAKKNDVSH